MYEKVLRNMLVEKMNDHFLPLVAAYRENYNTQHVLTQLLEEWRLYLDNNYFVGAVMTGLSKAFDCIPHVLLIAKLEAYGFDKYTIRYVYSYLKNRKHVLRLIKFIVTFGSTRISSGSNSFQYFLQRLFLCYITSFCT